MSRFNIPSCRNREFRNTTVSLSFVSLAFLSLCACVSQLQGEIVPLIHNGVETKPGKWPWHATLLIGRGICGGTFVDNNTILTAAHCVVSGNSVRRENDISVFGGRKYRDASTKDQQEFNLAKIIIHPQYNYSTFANDIAILKLTSDINITNFVRPVTIWNTEIDESQIFGSQGTVIGFGLDEDDEESDTLLQATIPVLDTQTCLAYDNETYGNFLTAKMYCAGGKDNVSACNGDSGGGMFFSFNDSWYLRGLVSFSPTRPNVKEHLCDSSKPTVFTDVTKYRNWILRYTNATKWLKELKPCKDGAIEIDTELSRRLYWNDVDKKTIDVASLDNPDLRTTVMVNVGGYFGIAVDPLQGKLYTTILQRGIVRSNLDGSEPELLLEIPEIYDITVSIATGELCYVKGYTLIECIDTRSRRIRTIVSNVTGAFSLAATDDIIYWRSYVSQTIESINLQRVHQNPSLYANDTYYSHFIVLADACPVYYSPCAKNNGGCPENTICLHNPRVQSGKICKFISQFCDQTDPSTIIKSKPVKPISHGEGKQRKWPWHVVIYSTLKKNTGYLCGGSIINMNTVLTAAHCFYYNTAEGYRVLLENQLYVSVGSDYVDGITDATQVLNVAQMFIHPQYNYSTFANDIAILKLSADMNITNYVRPATVWNVTYGLNQVFGMNGTVIGFRLDEEGEPSGKLREVNLNVIDTKTCLEYGNVTYGNRLTSQIAYCADGSKDKHVCNGDFGGGMYFNINGTWYMRGIVSFSACDSSKPTVFTDVTKYDKWILRHTNTTKWLQTLKPCKDGAIEKDTECNAASRFDHSFLLTSQDDKMVRVPMNGEPPFNVADVTDSYNIDYDCVAGRLYWADYNSQSIYSAKYDGTDKKIFLSKGIEEPTYIAVDWVSRRLYWLDYKKRTFEVASLENPNLRSTVSFDFIGDQITIDPLHGKLYKNYFYSIRTHNLDGSEEQRLQISNTEHEYVDIKASVATGELCYIVTSSRIECIDTRSKQILAIVSNLTETNQLAVTNEMIYWRESNNVIESINRHGMRQKPLLSIGSETKRRSLIAVTDVCPVFYSPCAINNGDCPANTLCLLNPTVAGGKICKCTQNCPPF